MSFLRGAALEPGVELPSLTRAVSREKIRAYAETTGDRNPLHLDDAYAASTPFGGVIAHGMLVLAYLSEMLTGAFGEAYLRGGRLKVRMRAPARPGDALVASGRVEALGRSPAGSQVTCAVWLQNQRGETIMDGEARIVVSEGVGCLPPTTEGVE